MDNNFVKDMEADWNIFPSPVQNYLTNKLRETGRQKDIADIQSLWAGQSAKYAKAESTSTILKELVAASFE